ncbi:MAG: hypothetical protein CALGDGBN_02698 [Pseudomonadales bacterium]|nr:hypothetical protein [Pseudomonadales bacterium]
MERAGAPALRPCTAADAAVAVPLIHASGPAALRYVFAPRAEGQALAFLHAAFADGAGEFGFRNHLAIERDGSVLGVAALWDGRSNAAFTVAAVRQIVGFYRAAAPGVLWRGLRFERVVRPAQRDVAYIGHVAVSEELRGQGVGRSLLEHLLARARAAGYRRAGLDVAASNSRARALYEAMGFTVRATRRSTLADRTGRVPDHRYMEVGLQV